MSPGKSKAPLAVSSALLLLGAVLPALHAAIAPAAPAEKPRPKAVAAKPASAGMVSYYKQVRPIFQARCQGCHQGVKVSGGYLMTDFAKLLAGGASNRAAVVPGQPGKSHLVELITPQGGTAKMPQGSDPLPPAEIALISRWIAQGARDDSTTYEKARFDAAHPPVYPRPPIITSLDFSPDGQILAVAGFHEVLLLSPDGSQRLGRLVGVSDRVQSVRFSPDGTRLAVTAGKPARAGEIQVWSVADRKLLHSTRITEDTPYGISWSPDGKKIAFGCADNTVRALDADTGQQVLQQGSHTDWVLGTAWSTDGSHLVSVSRDLTAKLTEVATQRFIDNITSITPGALKGGMEAVVRHPARDEVVIGGSDGQPRVFRLYRTTKRVIGDNANLVRELPAMEGRICSVAVSKDGSLIAAGSSLDGAGEVAVYAYDFDATVPDNIKKIEAKRTTMRTPAEKTTLAEFRKEGARRLARAELPSGVYAVAFQPDGKAVAAAGTDGIVRLIDTATGDVIREFAPAPVTAAVAKAAVQKAAPARRPEEPPAAETLAPGAKIYALEVQPNAVKLAHRFDYAQLLVTAKLTSGDTVDVTRLVKAQVTAPIADVTRSGMVQPRAEGHGSILLSLGGKSASVPISVAGQKADPVPDYIHDVQPVLSKLGCNSGTCHGAAKGKNGFKLSLRGYDPLTDVRALTDEHSARRVNIASPDDSLTLTKPATEVPHTGGRLFKPGDTYYQVIRGWIGGGGKLNRASPRVVGIDVLPKDPVVQRIGDRQQIRVLAKYSDGRVRDVSREAFIETGNQDVATANKAGLVTTLRRGEAPMLVRYEGAYAATTLTVMGDRTGFVWKQPEAWGKVDELVAAKWRRMKIQPSALASDADFLRRVYLDLTGLPPTADAVRAFLADARPAKTKRDEVIDTLVGSDAYVDYWTNKWADLLQVNRKFLGVEGSVAFRKWIHGQVAANTPYDQFAKQVITASGSNRENPAASYYKILRTAPETMENTTHLFLGVRFNCNKCHDHPFEKWTQDQYYQLTAYFTQYALAKDPESGARQIGGSAVEGATPLFEIVSDTGKGEIKHDRTGEYTPPKFPYTAQYQAPPAEASRRTQLAAWLTSADNQYFAKSYVNRLWGYLFGPGIIEPIDDIRAGNPPTNPALLDYLTSEFIKSGFDVRHVMKLIAKSRTYQLSLAANKWNKDDRTNYSHALARRLPAEVLYDTVQTVTGSSSKFPGIAPGTRAAALPDSGVDLPSGFLDTFGRPARESACECERTSGVQLGPVMALISGPVIGDAVGDPQNALPKLLAAEADDAKVVNELFLRIMNRPATPSETKAYGDTLRALDPDHAKLVAARTARETELKTITPKLEQERREAIASTQTELSAYEKELAPIIAQQEKERAEKIAKAGADVQASQAGQPARLAEWEKKVARNVRWTQLDPSAVTATGGTTLTKQPDRSILAAGPNVKGVYTFTAPTDLQNITAVRLEVLPHPSHKNQGPGRAGDGNFVLTELELNAAPASDPKAEQRIYFHTPLADFSQASYEVAKAVDGNSTDANAGWAVSPAGGTTHWATFQTKVTVGHAGGTVLTFKLHQIFAGNEYALGRFRISVATAEQTVGLSVADDLAAILDTAPESRTPEQSAALAKYYKLTIDADLRAKEAVLAEANQPLPVDPKLKSLKERLDFVTKPVPPDARLASINADLAASEKQLLDRRLTAAQDLTWALINSPAFLFNH